MLMCDATILSVLRFEVIFFILCTCVHTCRHVGIGWILSIIQVQSNLLCVHTSVLHESADKVRELDKCWSSIVYSRIIANLFLQKLLQKVR